MPVHDRLTYDLVMTQQELNRTMQRLADVMAGNLKQFWRLSELCERWGMGKVLRVPASAVLHCDKMLRQEITYRDR